jgi:hypothetical protein
LYTEILVHHLTNDQPKVLGSSVQLAAVRGVGLNRAALGEHDRHSPETEPFKMGKGHGSRPRQQDDPANQDSCFVRNRLVQGLLEP